MNKIKEIIDRLLNSLDTAQNNGFSGRKLTAFAIVLCCVAAHIKWIMLGNFEQLEMVLTIDYAFISALFGMTTYETIKKPTTNGSEKPNNPTADSN